MTNVVIILGFPGGATIKESASQCRRYGFDPWVRKIPWRREWQPTPVFLPGELHGQRSLAGYSPWGRKESDTTESVALSLSLTGARVSLVAQTAKNMPAMQETWVQCLGSEEALEKGMATHSSILAWRIPWTEEAGRLNPQDNKELDTLSNNSFTLP